LGTEAVRDSPYAAPDIEDRNKPTVIIVSLLSAPCSPYTEVDIPMVEIDIAQATELKALRGENS
jgi:hypothetical protein